MRSGPWMWRAVVALAYLVVASLPAGCEPEPPAKLGEPCASDSSCEDSLLCVEICREECTLFLSCGPTQRVCRSACQAPGAEGAACARDRDCGPGLHCGQSICRRSPGLGEPCPIAPETCAEGLVCNVASSPPACQPPSVPGADCASGCGEGFACVYAYDPPRCHPPGDVGAPCVKTYDDPGEWAHDCRAGLVCNWALSDRAERGQCARPSAAGQGCWSIRDCAAGLSCLPGAQRGSTCGP